MSVERQLSGSQDVLCNCITVDARRTARVNHCWVLIRGKELESRAGRLMVVSS